MSLHDELTECLKSTTILTEEVQPKMQSLLALVKDGVIQHGSAVLHFKQWLKDHEKYYERVRRVNKDTIKKDERGRQYLSTKLAVHKGTCERDQKYYAVNPDVYGAINTDSFGGFKG